MLVNPLDIFRDDHLNASGHFRIRGLLAAGTFAAAFPAYRTNKSAVFHRITPNGHDALAFQSSVGNFAQRLVEIETEMRGRDFIRRDIIAKLGIIGRILCVPRQIFARKLLLDQVRIFGQK